jgi:hypothetical protein
MDQEIVCDRLFHLGLCNRNMIEYILELLPDGVGKYQCWSCDKNYLGLPIQLIHTWGSIYRVCEHCFRKYGHRGIEYPKRYGAASYYYTYGLHNRKKDGKAIYCNLICGVSVSDYFNPLFYENPLTSIVFAKEISKWE